MPPQFKVLFSSSPDGCYRVRDAYDGNVDLNIVLDTEEVFFATAFTARNVQTLLARGPEPYFWAVDMFVLDNLLLPTILAAVAHIVQEGMADSVFGRIGTTATVYRGMGYRFAHMPGHMQGETSL